MIGAAGGGEDLFEGLLIVVGGLLGSGHCLGMCGGFVLTVGSIRSRWQDNLLRQLVFASGRIATYTLGGALAGFGGRHLGEMATLVNVQAVLSMAAGALLIVQGLFAVGLLPLGSRFFGSRACTVAAAFAQLLRQGRLEMMFVAGVVNGLLPCGLVYAFLALASSTASMGQGALTMALFGLGTLPALVLAGLGGSLVQLGTRRFLLQAAAICLTLTGVLAFGRGLGFLDFDGSVADPACPLCLEK